jgi:GNAT superfamily N-acetyltransferase
MNGPPPGESMETSFEDHYRRFLGIDGRGLGAGGNVFACAVRREPVCRHLFTACISTVHRGRLVHSVHPDHAAGLGTHLAGTAHRDLSRALLMDLDDYFFDRLRLPGIRRMLRYTVTPEWLRVPARADEVRTLGPEDSALFEGLLAGRGPRFRRMIWEEVGDIFAERRFFAALADGEIVSHAEVSDLREGGGNLSVATRPAHRRRGLGGAVVARAAEWCLGRGVVPVYWVDVENTASVALAESLGFRRQAAEIAVTWRA